MKLNDHTEHFSNCSCNKYKLHNSKSICTICSVVDAWAQVFKKMKTHNYTTTNTKHKQQTSLPPPPPLPLSPCNRKHKQHHIGVNARTWTRLSTQQCAYDLHQYRSFSIYYLNREWSIDYYYLLPYGVNAIDLSDALLCTYVFFLSSFFSFSSIAFYKSYFKFRWQINAILMCNILNWALTAIFHLAMTQFNISTK